MDPAIADVLATELYALVMNSIGIVAPDDVIAQISLELQIAHVRGEQAALVEALKQARAA